MLGGCSAGRLPGADPWRTHLPICHLSLHCPLAVPGDRPLFTQPYNLNRYEQDSQRVTATSPSSLSARLGAQLASADEMAAPLLSPLRVGQLSVVDPSGRSPFALSEELLPPPGLGGPWDDELAELFALDPEMSGIMSAMLESAVSVGLGLVETAAEPVQAATEPQPAQTALPVVAAPAPAVARPASARAVTLVASKPIAVPDAITGMADRPRSPNAVLLAEQQSDGSDSEGHHSWPPPWAGRASLCLGPGAGLATMPSPFDRDFPFHPQPSP